MKKTARFIYASIIVQIANIDPSNPRIIKDDDWDLLQQEVFDQLDSSGKFTKEQLKEISEMNPKDFLMCIREEDEDDTSYNRARAIWEYRSEIVSALEDGRPVAKWAIGFDALRSGAKATEYNY